MNRVEVVCYTNRVPVWLIQLKSFLLWLLKELNYSDWNLRIALADRKLSQHFNNHYRRKNYPTDILSFADQQGGDLLVCPEIIYENACSYTVSYEEELNRTFIHGLLHLGGWEHDEENPAGAMLDFQEEILQRALKQEEHIYVAVD